MERFDESQEVYKYIMKNSSDDFEYERLANLSAVSVQANGKFNSKSNLETYELIYNHACHLLNEGK